MTVPHLTIWRHGKTGREVLLTLDAAGDATGYNGHVDLGTGIRTALGQIVAEELDLPPARVRMVLGHTGATPDQGPTIASETIQFAAEPLRRAAAQARALLGELAAARLSVAAEELRAGNGCFLAGSGAGLDYATLLENQQIDAELDPQAPVKAPAEYRIVGRPSPRVDIPAKAVGAWTYVHDVRVPGMLHGHVIRPPYAGRDSGDFIGRSLLEVDEGSVSGMPGFVAVVRKGDFLGVVAEREGQARAIAEALKLRWALPPELPDMQDIAGTLRAMPSTPRILRDQGDLAAAKARAVVWRKRSYSWPWQMHGAIGPSCAVADWSDGRLTLWSGTQNPHVLQGDLAQLMGLDPQAVEIIRHEAAGCFGRNCTDDVCGDAALLSRAVGRPVRVQLTREQEHLWEPKGAAQLMDVEGGLSPEGDFDGYEFETRYPSNLAPNLALLLTGVIDPAPRPSDMGDRTAIPPYRIPNLRVVAHDMAPIVRASWFRGVSAMPNTFAHECFIDEMAEAAGEDPVAFRLRHIDDPRTAELIRRTAEEGGWEPHVGARLRHEGEIAYGQGFAYATYVHGKFPGVAAAQAAWLVEVGVNRRTGEVSLSKILVGQDSGLMINPDGVRHQIHGNVVQSISRTLGEQISFDAIAVADKEWGSYPLARFEDLPAIRTLLMERPEEPPLGVGESASVPSAAAIANAIFDATGVRMRSLPFTPEKVKAALAEAPMPAALPAPARPRRGGWRALLAGAGAALAGSLAMGVVAMPLRPEIPRTQPPAASSWSAETLERGRQVFALGDCAVCHTAEGGVPLAGGRPLETGFGTIHSTNLTPDPETGLGSWSYPAFARAMREGISRDGHHLYPAFPYTAFARITEPDMQALYAYIQSLDPVRAAPLPVERMTFPTNLRPGMALWNRIWHRAQEFTPDPTKSDEWNRGAYLVEGAGHCAACHSPRNFAGAEKAGDVHLSGAVIDGWYAPPLDGTGPAPLRWSEADFYDYLRGGSARHGAAAGPMAPVVAELRELPEADIRAMAHYLASLDRAPDRAEPEPAVLAAEANAALETPTDAAGRLFDRACGACHITGPVPFATGARAPLVFSSAVHAPGPESLVRAILAGVPAPGGGQQMPAFGPVMSDAAITEIAAYLRRTLAPGKPAWGDLAEAVRAARAAR